MGDALRVLIVDDSADDAELMAVALRQAGMEVQATRVDTADAMEKALGGEWDVILADYAMPQFSGPAALTLARRLRPAVPFLIVSGTITEEIAVELLHVGADDFVLKGSLARLPDAVRRAVREVELRRAKATAEQELQRTEQARATGEAHFRALIENAQDVVSVINADGTYRFVSASHERVLGHRPEELVGRSAFDFIHPDDLASMRAMFSAGIERGTSAGMGTFRALHKNGSWRTLEAYGSNLLGNPDVNGIVVNARDVTARNAELETKSILRELDQEILKATPLDDVLALVCERITSHFVLDLACIGLKELDGSVDIRARAGRAAAILDGILIRWDDTPEGRGPTGECMRTGKVISGVPEHDATLAPWRDRMHQFGLAVVAAVPLSTGGEVFGVLSVASANERSLAQPLLEKLAAFADQITISILNAQHLDQIRLETAALEASASAMCITDRKGVMRWVNPAFTTLTGYSSAEAVGRAPSILKSGVHGRSFYRDLWHTITGGERWQGQMHNRRKDGTIYIADMTITPVRDSHGDVSDFVAAQQDVTARSQQEERLLHLAMHDQLTDLPNRRMMEEAITRSIARAKRGSLSALLLLDVDNFKTINDSVGHPAGDRYLIQLGRALLAAIRPGDFLARFGGDEFAILIDGVSSELAHSVAERVRDAAGQSRFQEGTYTFAPTVSVGVALLDGKQEHPAAALSLADAALHAAKDGGRNRVVLYQALTEREMQLTEASQWAARIKDALRDNRFVLEFQPVVRIADGVTTHAEALVRMKEADGKIIPPGAFISAAERFGLAPAIDEWVVTHAIAELQQRASARLAVNLSGASLGDDGLLGRMEHAIAAARLEHGRLRLEITETAAVQDLVRARTWMERLWQLGCEFSLDDFGIGFSSFTYLRSLPATHVKIDGSFIRQIATDAPTLAMVDALVRVAHALGKQVIAEWVENQETLDALRAMGADYSQGFFTGRPAAESVPASVVAAAPAPTLVAA